MNTLDLTVSKAVNDGQRTAVDGTVYSKDGFASANAAWNEADTIAGRLLKSNPTDDVVLRAVWTHARGGGELALLAGELDLVQTRYEKALELAGRRTPQWPDDPRRLRDEATSFTDLGQLADLRNDAPAARAALIKAAQTAERLHVLDPSNTFNTHVAWGGYISDLSAGFDGLVETDGALRTRPVLVVSANYQHAWSPRWRSALGLSAVEVDAPPPSAVSAAALANDVRTTRVITTNLVFSPVTAFDLAAEVTLGEKEDGLGRRARARLYRLSSRLSF